MRHVLPLNMMAIAMGLHVRCGNEDNLWTQHGEQDDLGRADRAAGPHRPRVRPRDRHRQGSRASTGSASSTRAPTRPWPRTASRPTASPARRASCCTPDRRPQNPTGSGARGTTPVPRPHPRARPPGVRHPLRTPPSPPPALPSPSTSPTRDRPPHPSTTSTPPPDTARGDTDPSSRGRRFYPWLVFPLPSGCCCPTTCRARSSARCSRS